MKWLLVVFWLSSGSNQTTKLVTYSDYKVCRNVAMFINSIYAAPSVKLWNRPRATCIKVEK